MNFIIEKLQSIKIHFKPFFRKNNVLLAIVATILAVSWQEINLGFLNNNAAVSHGMLTSGDEASYLCPPQNFLKEGEWRMSGKSPTSYFFRPPGLGLYFMALTIFFGKNVWLAMKCANILLFFLSVVVFGKILNLLPIPRKRIWLYLYALLPLYSGFLYFTITEGISPSIVLFVIYFYLKLTKENKMLVWFIAMSAFLILLRPQLILLVLIMSAVLIYNKRKNLIVLLAFLPFVLWNVRSARIAGEWLGVHPVYHVTNQGVWRPPHAALTNIYRQWEHKPDNLFKTIEILWSDTTVAAKNRALQIVPEKYRQSVDTLFSEYQHIAFRQKLIMDTVLFNDYIWGEREFVAHAQKVIQQNKQHFPIDYYIVTPLQSAAFFFKSFLNLYIFQAPFRGNILCEILRWICFLLVSFSVLSSFAVLFFPKKECFVFALTIALTLFYFAFIQRMNEERYLYPLLPVALLCFANLFSRGTRNNVYK